MATKTADAEYVMLTFRVPVELADRLTDVAPHGHRSEAIRQAVEQYLKAMKANE